MAKHNEAVVSEAFPLPFEFVRVRPEKLEDLQSGLCQQS